MNDDPLAEFRREGAVARPHTPRRPVGTGERRPYEAFNARDSQPRGRLNIRRKGGVSQAPGYNFIVDIAYDDERYGGILLVFTTMMVKIRGRNLRPLVDALILGTCHYVQEFREDLFDRPRDPDAPFVETIEVVTESEWHARPS